MAADRPVRELLTRSVLVQAHPSTKVSAAAETMAQHSCGSILVMEGDTLLGIFTERDLLMRVVGPARDPRSTTVQEVMTAEPDTIEAATPVREAIRMMDEFSYRYLPVIEDGRVVGVVSTRMLPFAGVLEMVPELETRHRVAEALR